MGATREFPLIGEDGDVYRVDTREDVEQEIRIVTRRIRNAAGVKKAALEADRDRLLDLHYLMTPSSIEET